MLGYKRENGKIGIRNHVAVVHSVKCSEFVAQKISSKVEGTQHFGYDSCYSDPYAYRIFAEMLKHPNIASVLIVKLGCESLPIEELVKEIKSTGKKVEILIIQKDGGTTKTIEKGVEIAKKLVEEAKKIEKVEINFNELIIGLECGGSDATSGLTANPVTGYFSDKVIEKGSKVILSELPELLGTDLYMLNKCKNKEVKEKLKDGLKRAKELGKALKTFAVSAGNENSGLTTIEEKSLGAMCKAGTSTIEGIIKTGEIPSKKGLYILDKVGEVKGNNQLTVYEESDMDGFAALIASGAQIIIFTTGCGSTAGSVVTPIIKVCGNPNTISIMSEDIDIDVSEIITSGKSVDELGNKFLEKFEKIVNGEKTKAEFLGHEEYHILRKFPRANDVQYMNNCKNNY